MRAAQLFQDIEKMFGADVVIKEIDKGTQLIATTAK